MAWGQGVEVSSEEGFMDGPQAILTLGESDHFEGLINV